MFSRGKAGLFSCPSPILNVFFVLSVGMKAPFIRTRFQDKGTRATLWTPSNDRPVPSMVTVQQARGTLMSCVLLAKLCVKKEHFS